MTVFVGSWDVMAYRRTMPTNRMRRSLAYRAGYAFGATLTRLLLWPLAFLGDDE